MLGGQRIMDFNFINKMDADDILAELSDPAEYRGYLQTMSRFSSYSWRNIFLIYKQMPHASKLADYNTWKNQYKRKIKLGSTGIKINIPIEQEPIKRLVEKTDPVTGAAVLDENSKRIMEQIIIYPPVEFKQASMMDISHTEGNSVTLLAGDVISDKSLYEVFKDVLKIKENNISVWDAVKQIALERIENNDSDRYGFIINSVVYVVCLRFGINADADFNGLDRFLDTEMLETVCKHSDELIITIEDRFSVLCKERGLDPMTLPLAVEAEPQAEPKEVSTAEPQYSKELRTETIAGVEFSQYIVKPLTETETEISIPQAVTDITPPIPINTAIKQVKPAVPSEPPVLKYLPDVTVTINERNQYGYTRPELLPLSKDRALTLFRHDMTVYLLHKNNTEIMAHYLSDIENHGGIFGIAYGAWLNSREYIALASGNPEARLEAKFIYDGGDSFAVYQTEPGDSPAAYKSYEELELKGFDINRHQYTLVYTAPLPSSPSDTPAGLFMWVNAAQLDGYKSRGLAISDVLSIKKDEIINSYYANGRTFKELLSFMGEEGRNIGRRNITEVIENKSVSVVENSVQEAAVAPVIVQPPQTPPQNVQQIPPSVITETIPSAPPTAKSLPPALPEIKTEVFVCRLSAKEAAEHGSMDIYDLSRRMDIECAEAITQAIKAHNKGNSYDLTTPVNMLSKKYGKDRMKWVLSKHILSKPTGFTNDNFSWAKEYNEEENGRGDETPDFTIAIHYAILEAFVNEFRIILNKKPSFSERMKNAKKKSETYNNPNG